MGLHGDPDDYGLPKVDIVVPDDARELDRDVIAYRRELRQRRRRERWRRVIRPFTRYGLAAPFIASAVLIALISGVLMTVVAPRSATRTTPLPAAGAPKRTPGQPGAGLPSGRLIVDGKPVLISSFIDVAGVVLIVPPHCRCDGAATHLARQTQSKGLQVWLIADGRQGKAADDVRALAATVPNAGALTAEDPDRLLSTTYQASGLTALLMSPDKVVREVVRSVPANQDFTSELRPLLTPS